MGDGAHFGAEAEIRAARAKARSERNRTRARDREWRKETNRIRRERDALLNAIRSILHGDGVYYELSPTPRKLAEAAVALCEQGKGGRK